MLVFAQKRSCDMLAGMEMLSSVPVSSTVKIVPAERIFRSARSVDRVTKQSRTAVARPVRIELRTAPNVLVLDDRAIGRVACVETRCKLDVPVGLIAAPEREIDTRSGCSLYVGKLRLRPIFVVADIKVSTRVEQQCGIGCGIDARDVADVVAVLLQPIDRGVFLTEHEIRRLR